MSSGPPPPPPPPPPGASRGAAAAGGGRGGAPHPASLFGSRPPASRGAPAPFGSAKMDPAARRANTLSVYSQYTNPMASTKPVAAAAPPPPSSSSSTPAPPPPPPPPPLQRGGPAVAAPSPSSQPVRTPLPRMEALTAPDSSDALPPPPPPPSRAAAGPTPMSRAAGGASRYAVPDFTATAAAAPADRGGEFPASAGRHPDVVGVTAMPGSPFSPTAPPTASRSTLEAEAMAPAGAEGEKAATPLPATAAAPPPLTTRVSGAGLRGAASSRASSNGGGSRASSRHSQREPKPALLDSSRQHQPQEPPPTSAAAAAAATPQKDAASTMFMFAQDVGGRPQNEGAASATAPLPSSRPGSRSGSLHAHNAAAAAIASGGRRPSSSAATNAPSGAAGAALHRDVPSFLKPAGGGVAGLPQRGRLASNSAAGLATTPTATGAATAGSAASTSRGRELLEAALQSRGNRLAHLRGGAAAAASLAAKDSSATPAAAGGGAQPGKEMVTVRELPRALQQSQPAETVPCQDGEETTVAASAPAGAGADGGGGALGGTSTGDFSATSRSCGGGDSSNYSSPVLRVPPLTHGQASAPPSASAQAMASSAPLDLDRQQKGTKSANSILPSSMGNRAPSALIAGEVDVTSAEVLDVAQRHTPRSGALEPLPTPTGETSQHNASGSMQPSSAAHGPPLLPAAEQQGSTNTDPHHYSGSHGGAGGNPFAEAGGDSFLECGMDDGSEPAFGAAGSPLGVPPPPPPTRHPQQYQPQQQQQLPVQPPPLPRHAQYPGASPTGSPPPTARHSDRVGAPLSSATPPFPAAAAAAPQLPVPPPPLPHAQQQQQQSQLRPPMMPPPLPTNTHVQASSTANNNNNGFTTPRGHGAAGPASDPVTQPRPSLNRADVSHAAAPSSAARGPYVASPYVRDADNSRAMDDESPMPLRPPSFSSVPQPEEDEANEAAGHASMEVPPMEDDGEEDPFGGSAFREEQPPYDEAAGGAPATSATAVDKENAPSHAGADDAFQWAEDDAYSSNAASPPLGTRAAWEGGGSSGDVEEGARDSGTLDEHQRARQPTQLPSDFAALPASMPSSDPHPTQAAMATTTTAAATTPTAAVTSPPPPSHAAPGAQNRGAANPFSAWQPPVSHRDSSDALRRQHQEQLQARVLAAQQSAAGSGGSAPPPPLTASATATRGSPSAEDATRDLHGFVSPRGETPFSGSQYGSTSNLAHTTSQAEPQPEGAHPRTGLEAHSSPLDLRPVDSLAHPSGAAASASNPFLDADDDGAGGAGGSRNAAAASVDVGGLLGAKTHHRATSSLSSLPLQQQSPQPLSGTSSVNGGPALSVADDDGSGLHNNPSTFLSASGASANGGSAATSRTPGGTTLVNPFSKAARTAAAAAAAATTAAAAANGTLEATGGQSAGASLSNSFAGRRKTVRRVAAPCFAIFVGGATTGVPLTEMGRSVTCIAACFNHPRAASPTHSSSMHGGGGSSGGGATGNAGRVRSPASQPMGGGTAASLTGAHRTQSNAASSRLSHTGVSMDAANLSSAAAHANTTSPSSSSCLSFCSVAEALTTKGSVVDRKGIRGTESGRRYVQALREAVLPCAINAKGPSWSAMAEAVAALDGCVPAPLMDVLSVILKDALAAETGEGFAWKENGGRRLGEMLLQAAQAEARRYATTATSAQGSNAILAAALHASPLNLSSDTAAVLEGKEKAAVVTKLEDLLCLGKRVEAVEAALEARLYAHALLISMMCPTKEAYLKSVQAVMQQELCVHSPLAHAYSMFNELPLPPLLPPPPPSAAPAARLEGSEDSFGNAEAATAAAALEERRLRDLMLRDQASLKGTWRRHAAVLLANFTRHSGEGLLALAARLQQLRLVMESHTCLLLLHLTPLGMAAPVRAGAEPLPPASAMSLEEMEDVLPRPDQRQAMGEIRRRLGVVGGIYHPTQGCRAGFLTPVTTLLTQLLQVAHDLLNRRAPPLAVPGAAEGGGALPVAFHGLPGCAPRTDVAYRMMQVAWLREIGLVRESRQALNALLHRMPPPAAFSLQAPPRTLNELVYLFGAVPPPAQAGGVPLPSPLSDPAMEPADESTPGNMSATQQPSTATSTALAPRSADDEALERSERAKGSGSSSSAPRGVSDSLPLSPDDHHGGLEGIAPPPPPQQQQQQQMPPPPPGRPGGALPPASALAKSRLPGMTPAQRASALQPPTRQPAMPPPPPSSQLPPPPPQQQQQPQQQQPQMPPAEGGRPVAAQPQPPDAQADAGVQPPPPPPKPAAKPAAKPTSRRSRSMDALRNLFFRRGKSEAEGGEKQPPAEEAKPMHLDTEKPPEFDPVTGRWLFPETEEEKKLRELVKQGPPKMAPRAPSQPTPTPPPAPGAGGPAAAMAAQEPPASRLPSAPPEAEAAQASSPPPTAAMRRTPGPPGAHPAPQHGAAAPVFVPGRGAPPPMMAGRGGGGGVRRPGGRQQYVDMFNSAT